MHSASPGASCDEPVEAALFPTAGRFREQEILELAPTDESGVFVLYEYELHDGTRHRNAEFITVREGQIAQVQVFFGGRYDLPG